MLTGNEEEFFTGSIALPSLNGTTDKLEYRITAEDNSEVGNKKSFPEKGFHEVKIIESLEPLTAYTSSFENNANDSYGSNLVITPLNGFSEESMHTIPNYPTSKLEKESTNLIAQLKYPIVIQEGGQLNFDEVVLVEPGAYFDQHGQSNLWDYVIVEARKYGENLWFPITEQYNARKNNNWITAFTNSLSKIEPSGYPNESMFVNHVVNHTNNINLEVGDTAIFRFRLASDTSESGIGWAIDNLEIQNPRQGNKKLYAEGSILLYPNPVKNFLCIEWNNQQPENPLNIIVSDIQGRIIHQGNDFKPHQSSISRIDLSSINPGLYMVSINDGTTVLTSDKILKN